MSALQAGLARIILQFAAADRDATLSKLLAVCCPPYDEAEVRAAVDALAAAGKLDVKSGLEAVGGEWCAMVRLSIPDAEDSA